MSTESYCYLLSFSQYLDEQIAQHGASTTRFCVTTLLGGSQALWPACTECIFAVVSVAVIWTIPGDPESSVARLWFESACASAVDGKVVKIVIEYLLGFAREGPRGKAKAKMFLTDFSMIHRGEMSMETLISYSL